MRMDDLAASRGSVERPGARPDGGTGDEPSGTNRGRPERGPNAPPSIDRARHESFGGILSCLEPPFLAWVDREFMRRLGYPESPLWSGEPVPGRLSAPIEVHWAVTNRCGQGCAGCYMDSRSDFPGELSTAELKARLRELRDLGVFHVALGGGEAFLRPDFPEIVSWCRSLGLVPNLTTNAQSMGEREVETCRMMGQVNVSCDGVGERYGINGRAGSFALLDRTVAILKRAGVPVGINCVVSRRNYPHLEEVVEYAAGAGLNEVEFLKFKPAGRGSAGYRELALTSSMIRDFYPRIASFARPASLELKIDCSFIPALVYHRPPPADLERLAVCGCEAGNVLLAVSARGVFSGCSFVANEEGESVADLSRLWDRSPHLDRFRRLTEKICEPCRSCAYLALCRGGCRATARYYSNDFFAPDPECPRVEDYLSGTGAGDEEAPS